ncbi:hypothetical protein B0G69_5392 [Paraburkholderia sp. RAU2J]|nr:hypothetical protein B0G69_5392 [Paraburkholderia sp. RAU2J]
MNHLPVDIAMRRARHETWRVRWEETRERRRDGIGKFVFLDAIPDVEQQHATAPKYAPSFENARALSAKNMTPN